MIKKLRKRFIMAAMLALVIVLEAVMVTINVVNDTRLTRRADEMTQMIADSDGKVPGFSEPSDSGHSQMSKSDDAASKTNSTERKMEPPKDEKRQSDFSPETPYETRYFTVTLDENGVITDSNIDAIAAVTEKTAESMAEKVYQKEKTQGYLDVYRYYQTKKDGETLIIFLDCRRELDTMRTFFAVSFGVSGLGLLAVFCLVVVFSRMVFRPVAESYEKQKQFITDASHEIKTPLTIIDANTEVIEMELGENQWTKSTKNQVRRLSVLTRQLVTLARMDETGENVKRQEFSISDAVAACVEPFAAPARTQHKELECEIQEQLRYCGEERSIRQLVDILLDNAVKYTPEGGRIQVRLWKKGGKICLQVYNDTEEIRQGNLDCIFERFYRMDASRNSQKGGSGIGLSVARAVVTAHKGKITAYSEDGKSIRVTAVL